MRKTKKRSMLSLVLAMAMALVMLTPASAFGAGTTMSDDAGTELSIPNGDFEKGDASGWELTGYDEVNVGIDSWAANNKTNTLSLWISDSEESEMTVSYSVKLTAGTYHFTFDLSGAEMNSNLSYSITAENDVLINGSDTYTTAGWDNWSTYTTDEFTLSGDTEAAFTLSGTMPAGYWGNLDNLKLYGTGSVISSASDDTESSIYVPKVEGTDGDFMRGVDISSLLSELNSGVRFSDFDGNSLGDTVDAQGEGFFRLLAESGVNWVRIRVWNDPYDANGNGYGGGNCDLDAAEIMGQWATDAGLKVLIDFHYSDFWADPGKQMVPKAWTGYTVDEKAEAVEKFTYDSLKTLLDAGVDVGMIQIGNETTGAICGEKTWANMAKIYSAGSDGARTVSDEYNHEILVAVHFTNPESKDYAGYAKNLQDNGVDYDVFASSYYPYWHGTLDNLTSKLKAVADTYGKKVIVAETSWAYTLEEADGHADNIVRVGSNDGNQPYEFSVQGQATEVASIMQAVRNVGDNGVGVFYWEPAWIPVQVWSADAENADEILEQNKALWEKYGSGWASSYAAEYDPNDAGKYYGGSAMENQALFDFEGNPLESLKVFKYVQTGTSGVAVEITSIEEPNLVYSAGETLVMPGTVTVAYNIGSTASVAVTWNANDIAAVDMNSPGVYKVNGTLDDGTEVVCTIVVNGANLLSNPGFEDSDTSMYNVSQSYVKRTTDDPHGGSYSLHFYNSGSVSFTADQTVTLEPGTYTFSLYTQGDASVSGNIYAKFGDVEETADYALTGWANWVNPVVTFTVEEETDVTVGISGAGSNGAWGTIDDWYLSQVSGAVSGSDTLEKLIEQAEGLDPLVYTGASWAAMSACLEDAKDAIVAGTDLSEVTKLLQYAVNNLEKKSSDMALGSDISWCAAADKQYNNEDGESKPMYELITEDYGYNMVRLRTWTGDENGEVGKNTIIAYAKKCQDAGLRIMIDFHYADSWADPGKQPAPAAWNVSGTSAEEADRVAELLYDYTYDFMTSLCDAGVYAEWVQVGNEIDNGMVWDLGRTTYMENLVKLLQAGTDAVRAASPTSKVVIHRSSGAETDNVMKFYQDLVDYGYTDFDVIGLSFYPYDTDPTSLIESLGNTFDSLYETFCKNTNREIMVVEIGSNYMEGEGATRNQGYNMIINVINLLKQIPDGRGTGCMYWEIQNYEYSGQRPNIVWKAFSPGAELISDTMITGLTLSADTLSMEVESAETLTVTYTPAKPDITALKWTSSNPEVATVDSTGRVVALSEGETTIQAAATDGSGITAVCRVTVTPAVAGLKNGGFELGDQYWVIDEDCVGSAKISNSDNHLAGSYSLHYAAGSDGLDIGFHQDINGLEPGTYTLSCRVMGDKRQSTGYLYANSASGEYITDGWQTKDWGTTDSYWITVTLENIEVGADGRLTVGAAVSSDNVAAWGDFDEFTLVKTSGSEEPAVVKSVSADPVTAEIGDVISLPVTAKVVYDNGTTADAAVIWNVEELTAATEEGVGTYEISGTVTVDGKDYDVICALTINQKNLIINPGFEDEDTSMWNLTSDPEDAAGIRNETNNVRNGEMCLHYWSESDMTYSLTQDIKLPAGTYELGAYLEGGDSAEEDSFQLYVLVNGEEYAADTFVNGWLNWVNPTVEFEITEETTVTVGVRVNASAGAWGSWDDFYLYKTGDAEIPVMIESITVDSVTVEEGEEISLPAAATVTYSDGTTQEADVIWNADQLSAAEKDGAGTYQISGTVTIDEVKYEVTCVLTVNAAKEPENPPVDEPENPPVDEPENPPVDEPENPSVDEPENPPVVKPGTTVEDPNKKPSQTKPDSNTNTDKPAAAVKTGDEGHMGVFAAVLFISAAGVVVISRRRRSEA